jgi:cell division protein FtsA
MPLNPKQRESDIVVALDIGTTKVCAIAGRRNAYGKIEILGVGKVQSEGVLRGVVSNIDKTVKAIQEAVDMAEKSINYEIRVVHVGIAGQHIKSLHNRGILTREDAQSEIAREEVEKVIRDMHRIALAPGDKILHVIPQEFTVDEEAGIIDPVGMSGARLEGNFHIITGKLSAANNILRSVEKAGLQVADMTLEPIASASSVLSEKEKTAGVALVDIGGGTTDITIFQEGIIRHTAVIPFGGHIITKDIKEGCTVMEEQAEKLKVKFGSALADEIIDNRIITISGINGRESKEISERNLARIIQARMEEILDYVVWEIRRTGYERKLIAGLVLTGGGSLLRHLDLLSEYHTGLSTRIGKPVEYLASGFDTEVENPIYATAVGLMIQGIAREEEKRLKQLENPNTEEGDLDDLSTEPGWLSRVFNKKIVQVKEFFDTSPDTEF